MYTKLSKTIADVEKLCLDLIYFSSSFYKLLVALIAEVLKIPHVNNSLKILDAIANAIYCSGLSSFAIDEITESDSIDKVLSKAIKVIFNSYATQNPTLYYKILSQNKEYIPPDEIMEVLNYQNTEFEQLSNNEKIEFLMASKNKLIPNNVIPVLDSYEAASICSSIIHNPKSLLLRNKDLLDYCANRPDISFKNLIRALNALFGMDRLDSIGLYDLMFTKYEKMDAPIDNKDISKILINFFHLFLNDKYDRTDRYPHLLRGISINPNESMAVVNLIYLVGHHESTIAQMLNKCPKINLVIACILENCNMTYDSMDSADYIIAKSLHDNLEELLKLASKLRQTSESSNDDVYWSDMILEIPSDHIPNLTRELEFINDAIFKMECKPIASTIARYESITGEIFPDSWRLFLSIIDDDTDSFLLS